MLMRANGRGVSAYVCSQCVLSFYLNNKQRSVVDFGEKMSSGDTAKQPLLVEQRGR